MQLSVICDGLETKVVLNPITMQFSMSYNTYKTDFKTMRYNTPISMIETRLSRELEALRCNHIEEISKATVSHLQDTFLHLFKNHCYAYTGEVLPV